MGTQHHRCKDTADAPNLFRLIIHRSPIIVNEEWLKDMTYEIADVAGIAGEGPLMQVAPVSGMDKELDRLV